MVSIVDDAGAMLVPGTDAMPRSSTARSRCIDERGVRQLARFTHTGHNIGLETEERWLAESPDEEIEAGPWRSTSSSTRSTRPYGQIGDEETYVVADVGPEQRRRRSHG